MCFFCQSNALCYATVYSNKVKNMLQNQTISDWMKEVKDNSYRKTEGLMVFNSLN